MTAVVAVHTKPRRGDTPSANARGCKGHHRPNASSWNLTTKGLVDVFTAATPTCTLRGRSTSICFTSVQSLPSWLYDADTLPPRRSSFNQVDRPLKKLALVTLGFVY